MNPRIISDTTTNPWKYVTKIFPRSAAYPNADDAAYGTGILISNQIVLTAHHVLYHDAFGGFVGAGTSFAAAFNGLASIPRPFGTQTLNTSLGVDTNVSVDIGTAVLLTPVGILSQDVPGLAVFLNPADADGKAFMTAGFPSNVNSGQSMFAQDGTFGQTNAGITSLNGITLAIGQSGSPLLFNYEDHVYTVGVVHSFDDPNGNGTGDIGEPIYGTILTGNLYKNLSDRLNLVESNTDSAQLPQNIIFGGSAGDSFTGSHRREKIVLLGGNDMADGYKGDDEIYGGDGDDALFGGLGDDTLDGGAGADTLDGGSGDDTLIGGDGADVFVIGKGADRIVGADATDRLYIRVGSLHPFAEERQHGEPLPEDALGLPVRGGFLAGDAEWSIEAAQRFPSSFALYDGDVLYDVIQGHGETGFYARFAEEFWRTVTTTSATKLQVRGRVARTPLRQRVITGLVPVISIACRRASGRMAGSSPAMTRDEWRLRCPAASARRFLDCGRRSPS